MRRLSFIVLLLMFVGCRAGAQPDIADSYLDTGIVHPSEIITGSEQIDRYLSYVQKGNVAVVANQASLVGERHLVDTLLDLGANIKLIFCPEHGFRGDAEAGASVKDGIDQSTGLPIVSLYGNNKKPSQEVLKKYGINLIIFDLQDVGCRFYTYISTLHYVMEAAAEYGCRVVLLDRPNPNGHYVDGPVLEKKYQSFVGMHPVPIVYGMTIGEYAQMINGEYWLADSMRSDLEVITMQGYTHDSACCRSIVLPIPPSPNMRSPQAIALYPSLCLFEGTNISVGRGTDFPFEAIGCPSYRQHDFSFVPRSIPRVSDNPPHKGSRCYGMDLREADVAAAFDVEYLLQMYRESDHATFFLKSNFFEKLAGTGRLRKQIESGATAKEIRASWEPELDQFKTMREKYLLYP